jgi:hypothetical protein
MNASPIYVTPQQATLLAEKGFNEGPYAPEHWQVQEWLLATHGIWVSIIPDLYKPLYMAYILKIADNDAMLDRLQLTDNCDSPQEAYSKALDYILKEIL